MQTRNIGAAHGQNSAKSVVVGEFMDMSGGLPKTDSVPFRFDPFTEKPIPPIRGSVSDGFSVLAFI
jgi:hypothetical protein